MAAQEGHYEVVAELIAGKASPDGGIQVLLRAVVNKFVDYYI